MNLEQLSTDKCSWRRAIPALPAKSWKKIRDRAGARMHSIPLQRGNTYDVMEAYRRSHMKRDPLLAPHGFFRTLQPKRTAHALEFVEKFGPLDWSVTSEQPMLVLHDFWLKHLRYVSVVRLWEARDDENELRNALSELHKGVNDIHLAEGWERFEDAPPHLIDGDLVQVGVVPLYPLGASSESRKRYSLPWERVQLSFEDWLSQSVFAELREAAIQIFHGELNVHLIGREPRWNRMDAYDPNIPASFQIFLGVGNLWQRIWELTGLDTAQARSWRICPACNVIFYPKRSDQYYCKSQEQVLASKRDYARARRGRERLHKSLTIVEKNKTTNR